MIEKHKMKKLKSKEDLIETVYKQIETDINDGEIEAIEELLTFLPVENLIEYLPEEKWKQFKHLRDGRTTRDHNGS